MKNGFIFAFLLSVARLSHAQSAPHNLALPLEDQLLQQASEAVCGHQAAVTLAHGQQWPDKQELLATVTRVEFSADEKVMRSSLGDSWRGLQRRGVLTVLAAVDAPAGQGESLPFAFKGRFPGQPVIQDRLSERGWKEVVGDDLLTPGRLLLFRLEKSGVQAELEKHLLEARPLPRSWVPDIVASVQAIHDAPAAYAEGPPDSGALKVLLKHAASKEEALSQVAMIRLLEGGQVSSVALLDWARQETNSHRGTSLVYALLASGSPLAQKTLEQWLAQPDECSSPEDVACGALAFLRANDPLYGEVLLRRRALKETPVDAPLASPVAEEALHFLTRWKSAAAPKISTAEIRGQETWHFIYSACLLMDK